MSRFACHYSHPMPDLLRNVLPRLYRDVAQTLAREYPALLPQLAQLQVTRRCECGMDICLSFHCESADPALAPLAGRRPLAYPLAQPGGWYFVAQDDVLTGFELLDDYPDGYLAEELAHAGLLPGPAPDAHDGPDTGDPETPRAGAATVSMPPDCMQHLIGMRLEGQGFMPEEVVEFLRSAMAEEAEAVPSPATSRPSMRGLAMHDPVTGRMFGPRLVLRGTARGFDARSVLPEGLDDRTPRQ